MRLKQAVVAVTLAASVGGVAVPALAESTNSTTFEGWANNTATQYNGRIPRDVYLNEMGRRWDTTPNHQGSRDAYLSDLRTRWDQVDRDNRGLTPAEVSRFSGKVDSSTSVVPKTGSGVQAGDMGPGNVKGK